MAAPLATGTGLDCFHGTAPLFPLPNVALLPQVVQPLHVFEERYRSLTAAALQGPRLIGMAVLQPGWEAHYLAGLIAGASLAGTKYTRIIP